MTDFSKYIKALSILKLGNGSSIDLEAHATSHQNGGSDEIATSTSTANSIPKANSSGKLHSNWFTFGSSSSTFTEGNDSRIPSQDENDALSGTSGTPSSTNKFVTNNDSRNSDSRFPPYNSSTGTSTITATSISTALTITPGAGTYMVIFSGYTEPPNVATVTTSIFFNSVEAAESIRQVKGDGGTLSGTAKFPFHCVAIGTVTAGQAIEGKWLSSSGTASMYSRGLYLIQLA